MIIIIIVNNSFREFVSPANEEILTLLASSSISVIIMMNGSGPRTEPWGIPLRIGLESDFISPTKTCWVLPVR